MQPRLGEHKSLDKPLQRSAWTLFMATNEISSSQKKRIGDRIFGIDYGIGLIFEKKKVFLVDLDLLLRLLKT